MEEDRSVADRSKIGLEVTGGGGGHVGSGQCGRDVEERCRGGGDGSN